MHTAIPPSIHLFIHTLYYPSIPPFIHPFINTFMHPFLLLFIHLTIHLSIHLSIQPSINPSIYLFIHPSIHSSIHSSIYLFNHPSIHPSIHSSIHPSIPINLTSRIDSAPKQTVSKPDPHNLLINKQVLSVSYKYDNYNRSNNTIINHSHLLIVSDGDLIDGERKRRNGFKEENDYIIR